MRSEKLNCKKFIENEGKQNMNYLLDIKESSFTSLCVYYSYSSYLLKKHKRVLRGEMI